MLHLRRHRFAFASLALILLLAGAAAGQYRPRQQTSKGPRAIAVLEWDAKGNVRLVPVSILMEGKWYDGGLYKADPVPMALEPETVYEVLNNGDPVGLFTITDVLQQQPTGAWFATGRYREGVEPPKPAAKPAPLTPAEKGDDRPVLRRPGSQPPAKPPEAAPGQKPEGSQTPPAAPKTDTSQTAPAPPAKPPEPTRTDDEDVNRPVLRRGKPAEEQAKKLPGDITGPSAKPAPPVKVLVAVSDAKNNQYRPFTWDWKAEDRDKVTRQMTDLALKALNAYATAHPGPKPAATLQDVQLRTFDLDLSNEPELVLTARAVEAAPAPPAPVRGRGKTRAAAPVSPPSAPAPVPGGLEFYVTIVARQDYNGDLRKMFSAVSDSRHLDAYPRYELIDAVDADGNGRGELLFRRINDQGRSFVIYRVGPSELSQVFDGGSPLPR